MLRPSQWLGIVGLLYCASAAGAPVKDTRPNILLIFTDDQSYRTVSCYDGAPSWVETPNVDRLAREGVRFLSGYAGTWCLPSRAMFLTGLHPHAIRGLSASAGKYNPDLFRFWPSALRTHGYTTAMMGKWHLSADTGHGRAWDHSVVWNHAVDGTGGYYENQMLTIDGGPYQRQEGYSTDYFTDYAEKFLRRDHTQPWFLWMCYPAAHGPSTAAKRHEGRYRNGEPVTVPLDIYPPRPDKPAHMQNFTMWKPGPDGQPMHENRTLADSVRQYQRAVLGLDDAVGRLRKTLEETGQLENTFIVYTSDQGFAWGQHGFARKRAPYDDNLRAPFIVRMPGRVAEGKVCNHPVCTLDLVPTFLALAQTPTPWPLHGHDLTPILKDPSAQWPHAVMMEHFNRTFGEGTDRANTRDDYNDAVPWYIFLRQGRHKYIRNLVDNEIEELYDLENDTAELRNLAVDAHHQDVLSDYRQRLIKELERTKAGLIGNMPAPRVLTK